LRLLVNVSVSALILAVGLGGLFVFGRRPEIVTSSDDDASTRAVVVQTVKAAVWELPLEIEVDGEAVTSRVLTVGSEVTGRIATKRDGTRGGLFVSAGDVLFEIDSTDYQLEIDRLEAQLMEAEAELATVKVEQSSHRALHAIAIEEQALQGRHLARMKSLQDRNAATETDLDTAVGQELTARNAVQLLQNQINLSLQQEKTKRAGRDLANAQLEKAQLDLARCVIRSPIDGRIVDDPVEQGDFVRPGDVVVHISDSSRMEVKCSLSAEAVSWLWQYDASRAADADQDDRPTVDPFALPMVPCDVTFQFEGSTTIWKGYLSRYEGTGLDRETRMFPCRIVVDKPRESHIESSPGGRPGISPPTLLSGMYVTVKIPVKSPVPLVQVPAETVRPGGQIWIVRDDSLQILQCVPARVANGVALLRTDSNGVVPGDEVIVSPLAAVFDGMAVTKMQEDQP
jgi:multidrug efflux pump subunit AcrA (membrane-fusion protein)